VSGLLIAAIAVPGIAGALLALGGRRADLVAPAVSLTVAASTAVLAVLCAAGRPTASGAFLPGTPLAVGVDGQSAVLLPTVCGVALLVLLFAVAERQQPAARFHGLMLLFLAAVVVTVTATTLPALLLAWEVMGATSYALIGFVWSDRATVQSGFVAFIVTRTGDLGLYLAAGAAAAAGTGLSLRDLAHAAQPFSSVIAAGVLVAGLGKAAQLPFSFWLSRAMVGPSPVSALLHSAAMVAMGGYLLVRLSPTLAASGWGGVATAWVGVTTAVLLGVVAIAQTDLKQVLAASTASQLGFVVLAAGVGSVSGGIAQLVAHAATKALLFLVAGAWLSALGTRQLSALRGVARRWPVVGATFVVGAVGLAGLPPLSLWLAKDEVLAGASARSPWLYAAGLVGAALSAAYSARLIRIVLAAPIGREAEGFDTEEEGSRRVPVGARAPLIVLAVAAAALAVIALPPFAAGFRSQLGASGAPEATGVELAASAVLAIVIAGLVLWRGTPELRFARSWIGLERAATVVVARPMLAAAHVAARADDALARTVLRTGSATQQLAQLTGRLDRAGPTAAMLGIARVVAAAGRRIRRLQTGNLYQYYAAAVVTTVLLAIVLIVVR
jgi:NADH-quinone oxidoreductase subunit L